MLEQLTPQQALELTIYHATEPFGEVRADMRHAQRQALSLTVAAPKSKPVPAEFLLYHDLRESAAEQHKTQAFVDALDKIARRSTSRHGNRGTRHARREDRRR